MKSQVASILSLPVDHIKRSRALPLQINYMNYIVTWRCNSRCVMCNIWQNPPSDRELSLEEISEFFKSPLLRNLRWVQLSGGEAFLRSDLEDIIRVIAKFHPDTTIYVSTNGFLTNKIVEVALKTSAFTGNLKIGISIDGIGAAHEATRGTKNAFAMATKTLEALRQIRGIKRSINMTVLPSNYSQLLEVQQLAKDNEATFGFQIGETQGAYFNNSDLEQNLRWTPETLSEMECYVRKNMAKWYSQEKPYLRPFRRLELSGKFYHIRNSRKQFIPCFSGFSSLMLDPAGNVLPCLVSKSKMGNIRTQNIESIWFSEKAKLIRAQILKSACPGCWLNCENQTSMVKNPHLVLPYVLASQ